MVEAQVMVRGPSWLRRIERLRRSADASRTKVPCDAVGYDAVADVEDVGDVGDVEVTLDRRGILCRLA